jgi:probable HAF family extracellular repeat protein
MTDLGSFDGSTGSFSAGAGSSINALGEVVGGSDFLGISHGFLDVGGWMFDLGTLGGIYTGSAATSINASGVAFGGSFSESDSYAPSHAWIWTPTSPGGTSGQMSDLNALIPPVPAGSSMARMPSMTPGRSPGGVRSMGSNTRSC